MIRLLESLGLSIEKKSSGTLHIEPSKITVSKADFELMSLFRASFLVMGPLVAKTGHARISLPGGCAIGSRPVDLHLKGLSAMGAKISQGYGFIDVKAKKLTGAKIYLDFPSVGATENILMAACLADGETTIENVATEPEIIDLAAFLTRMGAKIKGAGTDTIEVTGVDLLKGARHKVIPDRIEAGTFMVAAAITRGNITVDNVIVEHLKPITAKLTEMGAQVTEGENCITVQADGKLKACDIKTLPYPGFPTDMQAQFSALLALADGSSMITETIFENRFMHLGELMRMGANVKIDGRTAVLTGVKKLTGAKVKASDLRAGAALVLAALAASGETEIEDIYHIDRGYDGFEEKLITLGADMKRLE